jgi:signal transduction histidine kinase/CheY-like chemotaxis protein
MDGGGVTERKRAEEALGQCHTWHRLLFENMLDGYAYCRMICDERGRPEDFVYLHVNDAFGKLTGLHDVVGKTVSEVVPGIREAHPELLETYGRVARSGRPERFELEFRPLGMWLAISVYSPQPDHFVAVFDNTTERKRAEQALRAANAQLTEADKRKSEFLAVLSHELRNPLAPIRNSIYLLERTEPDSEQAGRAKDVIRRQTDHLARLVDDLLDVTRISRGKIELQRAVIDAREVIARVCDDHRTSLHARGLQLRVETSGPAWIEADETRIAQIVGNLLQNAAKFGQAGGTVTACVGTVAGRAEISVRDDGMGIAPDLLPRVFEPFVQDDGGLARAKGGLGLGLALVKGLAELHGGSARAHSDGRGRGSEFVVTLPLACTPPRPPPGPLASAPTPGIEILVIEDNVDAAQTLAEVLEMHGHRVHVATDGLSGIAKARALKPHVILCDIGLPDVDGYEIARTLRADGALRATRLVALSGYAQPEDRRRAAEAGFDAHLSKPPSLGALMASLASGRPR